MGDVAVYTREELARLPMVSLVSDAITQIATAEDFHAAAKAAAAESGYEFFGVVVPLELRRILTDFVEMEEAGLPKGVMLGMAGLGLYSAGSGPKVDPSRVVIQTFVPMRSLRAANFYGEAFSCLPLESL